jgi:VWFA-related protein
MRELSRLLHAAKVCTLALMLLPITAMAQSSETIQGATSETPVLRTEAQLVIVDVTVKDKEGLPIHGLKREDFTLTEGKEPQAISSFEEYSSQKPRLAGPELPPLPPGTFTDYTPVPPDGALNILLLDTLNTPMSDQSYVRSELRQYLKKAAPGTRIAIFGLSRRLFLLQGFSSDPEILKDVVEHKLTPRGSSLLDDALGSGATPDALSDIAANGGAVGIAISNMQQFEAEQKDFQTQFRLQYTLDAFNDLAHYLSAFPGRKNLIWFSGSFPLNILPDPTLNNPFSVMEDNNPEFRETTNLLSQARVAVYPVDARALMVDPTFSAAASKSDPFGKRSGAFSTAQANEHMTMNQLAEDTGGAAFYNTNDLASAVQSAIRSGSNYYTLTYVPTNRNRNETYREIHVVLNRRLANAGYSVAYRHGYYANEQQHVSKDVTAAATTANGTASASNGDIYARAAIAHGAPAPQDILFKVRVLPIVTTLEPVLAADNRVSSTGPIKPPFRRFAVDIAAVGNDFQLTFNKDGGRRAGNIEFNVLLYDNDGALLNVTGKKVQLNLTPDAYKRFLSGVNVHLEISVPVKGGNDFLRIAVHDISSNRFGVVEVPVVAVARLSPLPLPPEQAAPERQQPVVKNPVP